MVNRQTNIYAFVGAGEEKSFRNKDEPDALLPSSSDGHSPSAKTRTATKLNLW